MQPKAMAGVPDSPGYVAAEKKDRYYVHWQLGVPRPHKKDAKRENKRDVTATSATSSFPATFTAQKKKKKNHENPAQKPR